MSTKQSTRSLTVCPVCRGANGEHQTAILHERNGMGGGHNVIAMCPWSPEEITGRAAAEAAKRADERAYFDDLFPTVAATEVRAA